MTRTIGPTIRARLYERYGITGVGIHEVPCWWCGVPLYISVGGAQLPAGATGAEIDHVLPVYWGGRNNQLNLVLSCAPCNASRGHRFRFPPRLLRSPLTHVPMCPDWEALYRAALAGDNLWETAVDN